MSRVLDIQPQVPSPRKLQRSLHMARLRRVHYKRWIIPNRTTLFACVDITCEASAIGIYGIAAIIRPHGVIDTGRISRMESGG